MGNEQPDNELINKLVQKELEKKQLNDKLDVIANSYSIMPDIIESLSGLRRSVETLNKSVTKEHELDKKYYIQLENIIKDIDGLHDKFRVLSTNFSGLENKLVDKNNSSSLIEVIRRTHKEQDEGMIDRNNPKSVISILKKTSNLQTTITWLLLSAITILSIVDKIL